MSIDPRDVTGDPFDSDNEQQSANVTYLAPFNRSKLFQSDDLDDMMAMQQQFMASRQAPSATFQSTTSTSVNNNIQTTTNGKTLTTPLNKNLDQFEVVDMFLGHTPGFNDLIRTGNGSDGENSSSTVRNQQTISADDDEWFNEQPEEFLPNRGGIGAVGSTTATTGQHRDNDDILSKLPQEYLKTKQLDQKQQQPQAHTTSFQRVAAETSSYFSKKNNLSSTTNRTTSNDQDEQQQNAKQQNLYKPAGFGSYLTQGYEINHTIPEDLNKSTTDTFNSTSQVSVNEKTVKSDEQINTPSLPDISGTDLTQKPSSNAQVTTTNRIRTGTTTASIDDDDNMSNIVVKARQRPAKRGPPTTTAVTPAQPSQPIQPHPQSKLQISNTPSLANNNTIPLAQGSFEHKLPHSTKSHDNDDDDDDYHTSQIPSGLTVNSDTIHVSQLTKNMQTDSSSTVSGSKQDLSNPRNFLAGMDVSFTRPIPTMFKEDSSNQSTGATHGVEQRTGGGRLDLSGQVVQRQRPRGPRGPVATPTVSSVGNSTTTPLSKQGPAVITPGQNFSKSRPTPPPQPSPADAVSTSKFDTGEAFRLKDTLPTYIPKQSSLSAMQKIVQNTIVSPQINEQSANLDDIDANTDPKDGDSDSDNFDHKQSNIDVGVSKGEIDSTVQMLLAQMQSMGASGGDYLSEALMGWSPERIEAFRNRKNPKSTSQETEIAAENSAQINPASQQQSTTKPDQKKSRFATRNQSSTPQVTSFLQSIDSSNVHKLPSLEQPKTASKLTKTETATTQTKSTSNKSIEDNYQNAELYRSILNAHNRPDEQQFATRRGINIQNAQNPNQNTQQQNTAPTKYSDLAKQIEPWELIPSLRSKYSAVINGKNGETRSQNRPGSSKSNPWESNSWLSPVSSSDNALVNHHQVPTGNNNIFLLSQISTKQNPSKNNTETATNLQLYQRLSSLFHITPNTNYRDSSYIALTTQLTDLRFDLDGKIAAPFFSQNFDLPSKPSPDHHDSSTMASETVRSQRELYHHGNQPHRAGYTIDEMVLYLRSTYQNQISLALRAINSIVLNARQGLYFQFCVGDEEEDEEDKGVVGGIKLDVVGTASDDTQNSLQKTPPLTPPQKPKYQFPASTMQPPSTSSWVVNNISSTILETILIREIPQLCLYLLINNQHGYQNQLNHNSTLVYYTLNIISTLLTPNLTPSINNLFKTISTPVPKPTQISSIPTYSTISLLGDSLAMCPCHFYSDQNASNTLFMHFLTSPSTTTLPQHLRLSPTSHPISPLHASNLTGSAGSNIDHLIGTNRGQTSSAPHSQKNNKVTPRFHTCLGLICPHKTNPYQNKGYYTHTDTPHYVQRALQSLYFEFTHPKLVAISKSRDIPLALIAQLDDEELAKDIMATGRVDSEKSPEQQRVQLYSLLSDQKRAIYLQTSHQYADNIKYCVERGNKHWNIDGMNANQLFLYDLVFGTLSIGTLSQLITLLQYYTYFTDPSLLASLFKNKTKGKGKNSVELDPMLDPKSAQAPQHSQFYSIQVLVLDVLLSLSKHSHTTAAIVACTDGLLSLLSKFLSAPALLSVGSTPQYLVDGSRTTLNPNRFALERRLLMVTQLLLQCADSHPIILSEIDYHISGSLVSYLTMITSNVKLSSSESHDDAHHQFGQILEKLNILNPLLWLIISLYNGGSTVLPLSLFDFNSNNVYLLYRSINCLLAAVLAFVTDSVQNNQEDNKQSNFTKFSALCQQYPALSLFISQLLTINSQLHLYIVSHLEEEETNLKMEQEMTQSSITATKSSISAQNQHVLMTNAQFESLLVSTTTLENYIISITLQTHPPQRAEFICSVDIASKINSIILDIPVSPETTNNSSTNNSSTNNSSTNNSSTNNSSTNNSSTNNSSTNNSSNMNQIAILTAVSQWCRFTTMLNQFYKSNDDNNTITQQLNAQLIQMKESLLQKSHQIKKTAFLNEQGLFPIPDSTNILKMVELHHAFPTYPCPTPTYNWDSNPANNSTQDLDQLGHFLTQMDKLESVYSLYTSLSPQTALPDGPSTNSAVDGMTDYIPNDTKEPIPQNFLQTTDSTISKLDYIFHIFTQFLLRPDIILAQEQSPNITPDGQKSLNQHPITHFNQNNMFFSQFLMNSISSQTHSEVQYIAHLIIDTVSKFTQAMNYFKMEAEQYNGKLIVDNDNSQHIDFVSKLGAVSADKYLYHQTPESDQKLTKLFTQLYETISIGYTTGYFITHILLLTNHHTLALQVFVMLLCNINIISFLSQYQTASSPTAYIHLQRLLHRIVSPITTSSLEEIDETDSILESIEQQLLLEIESEWTNLVDFQDNHADTLQVQQIVNLQMLHHTISNVAIANTPIFSAPSLPGMPATYFTPLPQLTTGEKSESTKTDNTQEELPDLDVIDQDTPKKQQLTSKTVNLTRFAHSSSLYSLLISTFGQFSNIILPEELLKQSVFPPAPQHIISHPCMFLPDTVSTPASLRGFITIANLVSMGFGLVKTAQTKTTPASTTQNVTTTTTTTTTIHEMIFKNALFYLFATLSTQPYLLQNFSNDLINNTPRGKNSQNDSIQHELIPQWLYDSFFITTFLSYKIIPSIDSISTSKLSPFVNLNWALFYNLTSVFEHILSSFVENGENMVFIYFLILLVVAPINGQVFKTFGSPKICRDAKATSDSTQQQQLNYDEIDHMVLSTPSKNETLQFTTAITLTILDVFPNLLTSFTGKSLLLVPSFEQAQEIAKNNFKFIPKNVNIVTETSTNEPCPIPVVPFIHPLMLSMTMVLYPTTNDQNCKQLNQPMIIPLHFEPPIITRPSTYEITAVGYSLSFTKALCQIAANHFNRGLFKTVTAQMVPIQETQFTSTFPSITTSIIEPIVASALISPILVSLNKKKSGHDDFAIQKAALIFQTLVLSLEPPHAIDQDGPSGYHSHPLYTSLVLALSGQDQVDMEQYTIEKYRLMTKKSPPPQEEDNSNRHTKIITLVKHIIKSGIASFDEILSSPRGVDLQQVCQAFYTIYLEQCIDIIKHHHTLLDLGLSSKIDSSTQTTVLTLTVEYHKAIETLFTLIDVLVELVKD